MERMYSVMYEPRDGAASATLVEAETREEACAKVLKALHAVDMDAVTMAEFSATEIGIPAEIWYLTPAGEMIQVKEDA